LTRRRVDRHLRKDEPCARAWPQRRGKLPFGLSATQAVKRFDAMQLQAGYAAVGIKEIACLMNFGRPAAAAVERSMRLLAERVMPKVSWQ
jgi:hypothetical protein